VLASREGLHAWFDVGHYYVLVLVTIKSRHANCELEGSNATSARAVASQDSHGDRLVAHCRPVPEDAISSRDKAGEFAVQEAC
jgi:hypothetical protein